MRALAAIKDPRAIAVMLKSTEDQSAVLNYWAREGLEALGLSMVYLMPE
jgi:HEAT repeat protein